MGITLTFTLCLLSIVYGDFPKVWIEQGEIRGRLQSTINNRTFYTFTGIPYAKPPVGALRFQPPQDFGEWEGVYNATGTHPKCLQPVVGSPTKVVGDEDCLFLNVYTPQISENLLPVMFFIHGGGFVEGSAQFEEYGPLFLMEKDVVLVAVNYRLGALGFFSPLKEGLYGNMGLKDQAFALKWVKRNIAKFGGDPNKITIFGHSAGGISAHLHVFSPLSRGMFKGVIAQSAQAFARFAMISEKVLRDHSFALANLVECNRASDIEMVRCLRDVKGADIIRATSTLDQQRRSHIFYFGPTVEPDVDGAFISKHPLESIKTGDVANVPFMTGITSEDGAIFVPRILQEGEKALPVVLFYYDVPATIRMNLSKAITKRYFNSDSLDLSKINQLVKMCTDGVFVDGAHKSIQAHLKYTNQSIYYYFFGHRGADTYAKHYGVDFEFGNAFFRLTITIKHLQE
uniref:Carboxylic ester hydrolase n=1 Tax=Photinus pyralis TaxID=7054 RepID=A0A1Y1L992_PHOPY